MPSGAEDQRVFGEAFSQRTGLKPRVVEAWLIHEQGVGKRSAPGSNNWLNIGYTDTGPNAEYFRIAHMDAVNAGIASARWLESNSYYRGVVASTLHGELSQAQAIIDSPWASSHYGHPSPGAWLSFAGPLHLGGPSPRPIYPTGTAGVTGSSSAAPVHVATGRDPPDRSPKIRVTGQGMGARGSAFGGRRVTLQQLRTRHVKLRT